MNANTYAGPKLEIGDPFPPLDLTAISNDPVAIPDPDENFIHLQLRRFAGCPICNLHLRSIVARHDEIRSRGIREVVVFHSTPAELGKYEVELPFPVIADPDRMLYRQLAVDRRPASLLSRRALRAAIGGQTAAMRKRSTMRRALGPVKPTGGLLGLPADFLIAPDGRITALKYGRHAYDQWTVDQLLELASARPSHPGGGT